MHNIRELQVMIICQGVIVYNIVMYILGSEEFSSDNFEKRKNRCIMNNRCYKDQQILKHRFMKIQETSWHHLASLREVEEPSIQFNHFVSYLFDAIICDCIIVFVLRFRARLWTWCWDRVCILAFCFIAYWHCCWNRLEVCLCSFESTVYITLSMNQTCLHSFWKWGCLDSVPINDKSRSQTKFWTQVKPNTT